MTGNAALCSPLAYPAWTNLLLCGTLDFFVNLLRVDNLCFASFFCFLQASS